MLSLSRPKRGIVLPAALVGVLAVVMVSSPALAQCCDQDHDGPAVKPRIKIIKMTHRAGAGDDCRPEGAARCSGTGQRCGHAVGARHANTCRGAGASKCSGSTRGCRATRRNACEPARGGDCSGAHGHGRRVHLRHGTTGCTESTSATCIIVRRGRQAACRGDCGGGQASTCRTAVDCCKIVRRGSAAAECRAEVAAECCPEGAGRTKVDCRDCRVCCVICVPAHGRKASTDCCPEGVSCQVITARVGAGECGGACSDGAKACAGERRATDSAECCPQHAGAIKTSTTFDREPAPADAPCCDTHADVQSPRVVKRVLVRP